MPSPVPALTRCLLLLTAVLGLTAATPADGPQVYKDAAGKDVITYVLRLPAKPSEAHPGLVVGFHGRGGDANQLVGAIGSGLEQAMARDGYVVMGLKSKADGWEEADVEPVRQVLEWAIAKHQVDPRRVYGVGYSSGAFFLNHFAPNHSALMAGAVTWVGGQFGLKRDEHPELAAELYWIVGQKDTTVPAAPIIPQMDAFSKAGYRGIYRNMRDLAHESCKEPCWADAIAWLRALRNKQLPLAAEDQALVARFTDPEQAKRAFADAGAWARLTRIGGPQAAPALLAALASDKEAARGNAALACTRTMFDRAVVTEVGKLLEEKSAKLRENALQALTIQAQWGFAEAFDALHAFLAAPKKPAPERRAAANAVGQIARLDLLGTFKASGPIWQLVDLLDDEDAGVRQLAFAALDGAQTGGFGYKPDGNKAARQAAVAQWAEWATRTCGARPVK
jgi:predicted esterase